MKNNNSDVMQILKSNLDSLNPTVSFENVWSAYRKQKDSQRNNLWVKKAQKVLLPIAVASALVISFMATPKARAMVSDLMFNVIGVENTADIQLGWHWEGTAGDSSEVYQTLGEAEKAVKATLPFPEMLLQYEQGALSHEYNVNTEKGKLIAYSYHLRTKNRIISIFATTSKSKTEYEAKTTESPIDKEVMVNGVPARLFAINEIPGFYLYLEKEKWKFTISVGADGGKTDVPPVTEEEMVEIAESIK